MWSHEQIHDHAFNAFRKALKDGVERHVAYAAMIDTAIAMAIDNAGTVAGIVGAHVAEDEILALKEKCTVAAKRSWLCRLLGCGA